MKNIYIDLLEIISGGRNAVLATVVSATGSTPQKPGSSALFDGINLISGTVGGGVVENMVHEYVRKYSKTGKSALLKFNLGNDTSNKYEAVCGGMITVLVDANPMNHHEVFKGIKRSVKSRIPGVLITMVTTLKDEEVLVNRYWMTSDLRPELPVSFMNDIESVVDGILASPEKRYFRKMDLSIPGEEPVSSFYLEPVFPLKHLVIAGAGHVGKVMSHLGKFLDFEVTVIDDRPEFANSAYLPDADNIIVEDIGKALYQTEKNSDTYIVIVTRGHSNDAEALKPCIGSQAAYVGMIGSRAKTAKMKEDFLKNGWATEEQWNKIYTPIGLEIGSVTVEEIGISIAAQLIMI